MLFRVFGRLGLTVLEAEVVFGGTDAILFAERSDLKNEDCVLSAKLVWMMWKKFLQEVSGELGNLEMVDGTRKK
jgi:hypothetical protein